MARPQITGTVTRRVELHCNAGGSNKDYVITLTGVEGGYRVFTEYGPHRRLQNGNEQTSAPVGLGTASLMINDLIKAKRAKGYQIVSDTKGQSNPQPTGQKKKARPAPAKQSIAQLAPEVRARLGAMF